MAFWFLKANLTVTVGRILLSYASVSLLSLKDVSDAESAGHGKRKKGTLAPDRGGSGQGSSNNSPDPRTFGP